MSQDLLHRTFLDLIFGVDGESSFSRDPRAFGADRGLDERNQEALAHFQRRLRVYKGLVKASILDPIPDCFPILKALLEEAAVWPDCLDAFFASRSVQSLYYREVNPTFLAWLADSAWGQNRWPCLLHLAHWEYMEMEVLIGPESVPVSGLKKRPKKEDRAIFDGVFRNLAYGYRVHEACEDAPEPTAGTTFLLCLRNPVGRFESQEVDGRISAFLARALEQDPLGRSAEAVGLPWEEALALLLELKARGGILGFQGGPALP